MATDDKKKYVYIGTSTNPDDSVFDVNHFNDLRNKRKYQEAYNYATQFALIDGNKDIKYRAYLDDMLRAGRIESYTYEHIDESLHPAIDFKNAVLEDGGLERLDPNNEYAKEFIKYKDEVGNGQNTLYVTFEPQIQKLFGKFDYLKPDNNDNNINAFYERSGLNEQQLKMAGISVGIRDGKDYIEFDKSNPLANKILLNINADSFLYPSNIYGVDEKTGKYVKDNSGVYPTYQIYAAGATKALVPTLPIHPVGAVVSKMIGSNLKQLQRVYKSCEDIEKKAYENGTAKAFNQSSIYMPLLYDNAISLDEAYSSGDLKTSDYNSLIKRENTKLLWGLKGATGFAQYEVSSTINNDDVQSPINQIADDKTKKAIYEEFDKRKLSDLTFGIAVVGDKVGLKVVVPPRMKGNTNEQLHKGFEFTVFDYETDLLKQQIYSDPEYKTKLELVDMQALGYPYTDVSGHTYQNDGRGNWIVDGTNIVDEDLVFNKIKKDLYAKELSNALILNNINKDGDLFTSAEDIKNQALLACYIYGKSEDENNFMINAIKRLYGNDIDYNNDIQIANAIFNLMDDYDMNEEVSNHIQREEYNAIKNVYDLYYAVSKNFSPFYMRQIAKNNQ